MVIRVGMLLAKGDPIQDLHLLRLANYGCSSVKRRYSYVSILPRAIVVLLRDTVFERQQREEGES